MRKSDEYRGTKGVSVVAAYVAIASAIAAFGLLVSLHLLSPEFSPAWRLVSEYANGHYPLVLSLMFGAYGLATLALVWAIKSDVATRGGTVGLAFLIASGIGQASASVFSINLPTLHYLAGAFGVLCLPIGAVLVSRSLGSLERWSAAKRPLVLSAHLTWIAVVLFAASFPLMMVTFVAAQGALPSSPPAQLPHGVVAVVGWFDRLILLSAWGWVSMAAGWVIAIQRTERARGSRIANSMALKSTAP